MPSLTNPVLAASVAGHAPPGRAAAFADRWIFVFMASLFVAIILGGFIPDSIEKIAAVQSGKRPPFPLVLHLHAVLMGAFMLLLLAQTWLAATGHRGLHMQTGAAAFAIVPALVVVGFVLAPTMYHEVWNSWQAAGPADRERLAKLLARRENILLIQFRMGILFPLFVGIALAARRRDSGLHKRMMILASAVVLPPGIDRMTWLPSDFPASFATTELYMLAVLSPMFLWDVLRNRRVHHAYGIWLALTLPVAAAMHLAWDTPWWHATARGMMGV